MVSLRLRGGAALARVGRSTRGAADKDKAKMAGGGSAVHMADRPVRRGAVPMARAAQRGGLGRRRALARGRDQTGRQPTMAVTYAAAALPRTNPTRRKTKRPSCRSSRGRGRCPFGARTSACRPLGHATASPS